MLADEFLRHPSQNLQHIPVSHIKFPPSGERPDQYADLSLFLTGVLSFPNALLVFLACYPSQLAMIVSLLLVLQ